MRAPYNWLESYCRSGLSAADLNRLAGEYDVPDLDGLLDEVYSKAGR